MALKTTKHKSDFFILNTVNPQRPLANVPVLNISYFKELTLYQPTPSCFKEDKWVSGPRRKPVYQNSCCFIISDITLTFQRSYNLIALGTLRQHCLSFVKILIYILPSIMGPWSMTGTHRHYRNTATQQHFFNLCLGFMHKYT